MGLENDINKNITFFKGIKQYYYYLMKILFYIAFSNTLATYIASNIFAFRHLHLLSKLNNLHLQNGVIFINVGFASLDINS